MTSLWHNLAGLKDKRNSILPSWCNPHFLRKNHSRGKITRFKSHKTRWFVSFSLQRISRVWQLGLKLQAVSRNRVFLLKLRQLEKTHTFCRIRKLSWQYCMKIEKKWNLALNGINEVSISGVHFVVCRDFSNGTGNWKKIFRNSSTVWNLKQGDLKKGRTHRLSRLWSRCLSLLSRLSRSRRSRRSLFFVDFLSVQKLD